MFSLSEASYIKLLDVFLLRHNLVDMNQNVLFPNFLQRVSAPFKNTGLL